MRSYLPGIYCLGVCFYTLLDHMDMFLLEPSVLSHTNSWWFPVGLLLQHRLTSALCLHERGHGSHVYIPSFSFPFLRSCCFFYTSGILYSVRTGNDCGREVCKLVDISLLQPGSVWAGKTLPLKGEQHKLVAAWTGAGAQSSWWNLHPWGFLTLARTGSWATQSRLWS